MTARNPKRSRAIRLIGRSFELHGNRVRPTFASVAMKATIVSDFAVGASAKRAKRSKSEVKRNEQKLLFFLLFYNQGSSFLTPKGPQKRLKNKIIMYIKENSNEFYSLEDLVDSYGTANVLAALREVCYAKAQHVSEAWQDGTLAKAWEKTAKALDNVIVRMTKVSPL